MVGAEGGLRHAELGRHDGGDDRGRFASFDAGFAFEEVAGGDGYWRLVGGEAGADLRGQVVAS